MSEWAGDLARERESVCRLESDTVCVCVCVCVCVQALLSLPVEERSEYKSLVGDAALLLEQLLINKKVRATPPPHTHTHTHTAVFYVVLHTYVSSNILYTVCPFGDSNTAEYYYSTSVINCNVF